jgi:hypothetical protein
MNQANEHSRRAFLLGSAASFLIWVCWAKGKEQHMEIKRVGSQPSGKGPSDWFTGIVRIDPLFTAPDPTLVAGVSVTFEPGAHCMAHASAWANSYRHRWLWMGATRWRTDRRDSPWRCCVVLPNEKH